ncbi:hypothetical protein [Desulfobacula sp.]
MPAGVTGYRLPRLKDLYYLYDGSESRIQDPYFKSFGDFKALKTYAQVVEDFEILS